MSWELKSGPCVPRHGWAASLPGMSTVGNASDITIPSWTLNNADLCPVDTRGGKKRRRIMCRGRRWSKPLPIAPQLLAFSPGKEQAAGVWETCLAPGWPQLRSRLPFGPRSQASLQKAQGPGVCKVPKPPASRALCQAKRAPRAAFPSACLAAQTKRWAEGISVPAPLAGRDSTTARGILRLCPASACKTGLPWSSPQRRVVWMWFGAFPGVFGIGRAQPQRRGTSP